MHFLEIVKEFVRTLPSQAMLCRTFMFTQQESISVGCILPVFLIQGEIQQTPWTENLLDRDPPGREPPEGTWDQEQRLPRRNMGPGSQTGSDIIQRQQSVKT